MHWRNYSMGVNRYCSRTGSAGYMNLFESPGKFYKSYNSIKISADAYVHDVMPQSGVFNTPNDVKAWVKKVNEMAVEQNRRGKNYAGAFPTFEQAIVDNTEVIGVNFIKGNAADFKKVAIHELRGATGIWHIQHAHERFKAIDKYVNEKLDGYISGFPVFPEEDNPNFIHYLAIKEEYAERIDIPEPLIHANRHYNFNTNDENGTADLSGPFINRIFIALDIVLKSLDACSHISDDHKRDLVRAVHRTANISRHSGPAAGAAIEGGNDIWLNETLFSSLTDAQLAETLIHELMHIAGHNHINHNPSFNQFAGHGCGINQPGITDDARRYYESIPLRSECCINGNQNLSLRNIMTLSGEYAIKTWNRSKEYFSANNVEPWQIHQVPELGPGETFTFEPLGGNKYAIKTWTGKYMSANSAEPWQIHQVPELGPGETFTFEPLGGNKYAIKTWTGKYMSANNVEPWQIHQMPELGPGETFTLQLI